uniref:Kringle domain-containing protein n=1 Tax=Macrostomum lignano TaxID=282301 RepID=A0A1I8HFY7_9PLAT
MSTCSGTIRTCFSCAASAGPADHGCNGRHDALLAGRPELSSRLCVALANDSTASTAFISSIYSHDQSLGLVTAPRIYCRNNDGLLLEPTHDCRSSFQESSDVRRSRKTATAGTLIEVETARTSVTKAQEPTATTPCRPVVVDEQVDGSAHGQVSNAAVLRDHRQFDGSCAGGQREESAERRGDSSSSSTSRMRKPHTYSPKLRIGMAAASAAAVAPVPQSEYRLAYRRFTFTSEMHTSPGAHGEWIEILALLHEAAYGGPDVLLQPDLVRKRESQTKVPGGERAEPGKQKDDPGTNRSMQTISSHVSQASGVNTFHSLDSEFGRLTKMAFDENIPCNRPRPGLALRTDCPQERTASSCEGAIFKVDKRVGEDEAPTSVAEADLQRAVPYKEAAAVDEADRVGELIVERSLHLQEVVAGVSSCSQLTAAVAATQRSSIEHLFNPYLFQLRSQCGTADHGCNGRHDTLLAGRRNCLSGNTVLSCEVQPAEAVFRSMADSRITRMFADSFAGSRSSIDASRTPVSITVQNSIFNRETSDLPWNSSWSTAATGAATRCKTAAAASKKLVALDVDARLKPAKGSVLNSGKTQCPLTSLLTAASTRDLSALPVRRVPSSGQGRTFEEVVLVFKEVAPEASAILPSANSVLIVRRRGIVTGTHLSYGNLKRARASRHRGGLAVDPLQPLGLIPETFVSFEPAPALVFAKAAPRVVGWPPEGLLDSQQGSSVSFNGNGNGSEFEVDGLLWRQQWPAALWLLRLLRRRLRLLTPAEQVALLATARLWREQRVAEVHAVLLRLPPLLPLLLALLGRALQLLSAPNNENEGGQRGDDQAERHDGYSNVHWVHQVGHARVQWPPGDRRTGWLGQGVACRSTDSGSWLPRPPTDANGSVVGDAASLAAADSEAVGAADAAADNETTEDTCCEDRRSAPATADCGGDAVASVDAGRLRADGGTDGLPVAGAAPARNRWGLALCFDPPDLSELDKEAGNGAESQTLQTFVCPPVLPSPSLSPTSSPSPLAAPLESGSEVAEAARFAAAAAVAEVGEGGPPAARSGREESVSLLCRPAETVWAAALSCRLMLSVPATRPPDYCTAVLSLSAKRAASSGKRSSKAESRRWQQCSSDEEAERQDEAVHSAAEKKEGEGEGGGSGGRFRESLQFASVAAVSSHAEGVGSGRERGCPACLGRTSLNGSGLASSTATSLAGFPSIEIRLREIQSREIQSLERCRATRSQQPSPLTIGQRFGLKDGANRPVGRPGKSSRSRSASPNFVLNVGHQTVEECYTERHILAPFLFVLLLAWIVQLRNGPPSAGDGFLLRRHIGRRHNEKRLSVQSALAILDNDENKGNDQLNVTLVTRNFPILFDENFVLQCTPSAEIADQVTKIYFSWRYGALSNSSDVTPVLDFGNGTLVFTRVGVNYGDVWCHAKLLNGTVLKGSVLFVPFYPPVFSPHMETGKVSNTFSYRQELKPGYEAELYCSGQCSCSFELDWLIRIDGAEAEKLQLGTDVQRLLTSLVWHSKPSAYRLEFQQSAGRSKKVTRIVRVGSRVQVLCRLRALTGPTMIELNPVLLYAPHSAVGTFDIILAPPPETLTTTAPVIETCHPLSSFLPKSHGCWPHLGHLAANGTRAVRERLLNSSAVLPEAAANSADVLDPHMTHCTALAQALLCSSALCSDKPCRQHCLLVRDHVCSSEVKLLRRFPDCELFPDADSEPGCHARFDLEAVMLRHARPASGALESDDSTNTRGCFSRRDFWRGLFYREPSDRAEAVQSGCAKWSSAANRLLSADYFASLRDAGSECRNPGAQFPGRRAFFITCPVLECPEDQLPLGLSGLGMSDPIRTAVIVAAVAFVILLCCIILGIMLHRRNVAKSSTKSVSLAQSHQLLSGDPGDPNMIIQRNVKFGQKTHLPKPTA